MKKNFIILSSIIFILLFSSSCATVHEPEVEMGKLASLSEVDLYTISRGEAEAIVRNNSTGHYADVFVIFGQSDSVLGYNKTTARDLAILDAKKKLSTYMNGVVFSTNNYKQIADAIEQKIKDEYSDDINNAGSVDASEALKAFMTSLSYTQISSFLIEKTQYRDAVSPSGFPYVEARVLCTVSDRVINEIQKLISIAFENDEIMSKESIEVQRAWMEATKEVATTMFKEEAPAYFDSIQ